MIDRDRPFHGPFDEPSTPILVVDTDVVTDRYVALAAALPSARLFYAVKANPAPDVLTVLEALGAAFDVASPAEIDACLAAGADADRLSYGNTVKKPRDIALAYEAGVRRFAFDCEGELDKLIRHAPGSVAVCRLATDGGGADWPLSAKFGTDHDDVLRLLDRAAAHDLRLGVSFHVGSQQRHPNAWDRPLALVGRLRRELLTLGRDLSLVNLGGGFPGQYRESTPDVSAYGDAIEAALATHLPGFAGEIVAEPGRYVVADAGVIEAEVVTVAWRSDGRRWVYLDIGLFGGLAETMGEAIRYPITTAYDGTVDALPDGPVVLAGPTCDSADVLYERSGYRLPLALQAGDRVRLHATGAYTSSYSAVAFNGFAPLASRYQPSSTRTQTRF